MSKKLLSYFVSMLAFSTTSYFAEDVKVVNTVPHNVVITKESESSFTGKERFSEKFLKLQKKPYIVRAHTGKLSVQADKISSGTTSKKDVSYFENIVSQATNGSSHTVEASLHLSPYIIPYFALKNFSIDMNNYGIVLGNIPNIPLHIIFGKFSAPFGSGLSDSIESNFLKEFGANPNIRGAALNLMAALHQNVMTRVSLFASVNDSEKPVVPTKVTAHATPEKPVQTVSVQKDTIPWGGNMQFDLKNTSAELTIGLSYLNANPKNTLLDLGYSIKESLNAYVQIASGPIKLHAEGITAFGSGMLQNRIFSSPKNAHAMNLELVLDLLKVSKLNSLPCKFVLGWTSANTGNRGAYEKSDRYNLHHLCAAFKFDKIGAYTDGLINAVNISHKWNITAAQGARGHNTTIEFMHDFT